MTDEDRFERGARAYLQLRGEAARATIEKAQEDSFGAARARWTVESCFGDIWTRPGLDLRARSLVTLGMLLALRLPEEFKNHCRIGLRNGLTPTELEEVVMHSSPYLGLPGTTFASRALEEVLAEPRT